MSKTHIITINTDLFQILKQVDQYQFGDWLFKEFEILPVIGDTVLFRELKDGQYTGDFAYTTLVSNDTLDFRVLRTKQSSTDY